MSRRVIAVGRTLSGKTEWVWRRYVRREPRVLIIDPGEWRVKHQRGAIPNAMVVSGADGIRDALLEVAETRQSHWCIIADADRDELEEVQELLIPAGRWEESPVPRLGGMAIFMDEVDISIPLRDSRLAGFNRRGRHVGLSVYMATQRPGSVNKEATSMADWIGILSLDEVSDVKYLRDRLGREKADKALAWANSGQYRAALFHPPTGQLWLLPPEPD